MSHGVTVLSTAARAACTMTYCGVYFPVTTSKKLLQNYRFWKLDWFTVSKQTRKDLLINLFYVTSCNITLF
jgi:hypothetical protein